MPASPTLEPWLSRALRAWRLSYPQHPAVGAEAVKIRPPRSVIVRLALDTGETVIAKGSADASLSKEARIYEALSLCTTIPTPRLYGPTVDGQDGFAWMFMEELATADPETEIEMGQALARMHVAAAELQGSLALPDHGIDLHRRMVETLVRSVGPGMSGAGRPGSEDDVLTRISTAGALLQRSWKTCEDLLSAMPSTLVHGDVVRKNFRLRVGTDNRQGVLIDWGNAGWGCAAIDLAFVSIPAYHATTITAWTHLDLPTLTLLQGVGVAFWLVRAVLWEMPGMRPGYPHRVVKKLHYYADELEVVLPRLGV